MIARAALIADANTDSSVSAPDTGPLDWAVNIFWLLVLAQLGVHVFSNSMAIRRGAIRQQS